jgi:hypothetical protein
MKQLKHWQDPVNALLGLWLVISPWALAYVGDNIATRNAVIVGVLLIAAAAGAMLVPRAWEEWTEVVLGLWLVVAPMVLGFSGNQTAQLVAVATGVVVAALALWTVLSDRDYSDWLRRGSANQ